MSNEAKDHCRSCGSTLIVENEASYCEPCLNRRISDLCMEIIGFLNNLEQILDVSKDEFVRDEMRQQAAGFQLMKWATWCTRAPNRFGINFPAIDMRSTWLMSDTPNWKEIYEIRNHITQMKQIAQAGIL
jgi:hypothetical protein